MNEVLIGSALFTAIVLVLGLVVLAARALLLPSREVSIVVNGERTLTARTNQKLLFALLDAGIPVPSACAGVGTCGLCRVTVTAGAGEILPTETARLSRREIRDGTRLACQVAVREDIEAEVPGGLERIEPFECTVLETEALSPLIRQIVLAVPEGMNFRFRAGAFVQATAAPFRLDYRDLEIAPKFQEAWRRLSLENLVAAAEKPVTRAYSIANTPADKGRIVLLVRLAVPPPHQPDAPPGIVSSFLFGLRPGDRLAVCGPYGTFAATESEREMIFIAGGVGMAPLRAIIYDQLERLKTARRISFWYGARSRIDLFYEQGFEKLAADHSNFTWTVALSDPAPEDSWEGDTGFIHTVVDERYLKSHPAPDECEYYLCGPPLMVQAVLSMLEDNGVDEESVFFDDFGSQ